MIWFAVSGCILSFRSSVISDACAQKSLDTAGVTVTGTGAQAASKRLIAPIAFNGFVLLKDVEASIDGFHVLVEALVRSSQPVERYRLIVNLVLHFINGTVQSVIASLHRSVEDAEAGYVGHADDNDLHPRH
jgi:hypothetical protein